MTILLPYFLDEPLCLAMLVASLLTLHSLIMFTLVCFVTTWSIEHVFTYLVSLSSPVTHTVSLPLPPVFLLIMNFLVEFCHKTVDINYGQYSCNRGCHYAVHPKY